MKSRTFQKEYSGDMDRHLSLELKQILNDHEERTIERIGLMIERKVSAALISAGVSKSHITKTEAYKRYGRTAVDRWVSEGRLHSLKDGDGNARSRISVVEIEGVAASCNHPAVVRGQVRTRRTKTGVPYPQKS